MTEESAVAVCVRVRPLIEREESGALENAEPVQLFWKADKKSIHQIDDGNSTKSFSFDRVFTADETTNQLYQTIAKPLVVSTVEGYNGTIFAYGQTSSGKTFTMMGSKGTPGVIPLAVEDVFQTIKNFPKKEFLLRVSYMEIYNETVTDLLVDSWKRKPLEIRETINKNIYVADLTEELVTTPAQALAWIRKGEKNRHYGKTKMNQRSSRSHTMFRMILESRERSDPASGENADGAIIVSHLNLVDLAGSERASQTGAEGARLKEGCNINRSLFILGQVIKKVTDENQKGFTNYRDSKLTRILQNSLGGNAKTVIICTITPVALEETLSTLQFASTAKKMKNDPHVTEVSDDGALLKRYRNEIVDLKRRLQEVSSVTQTTATEKEVLSQLLQEKDQLQREQEDRIKNLTKLLVTSSNQFQSVPKMPKRRVTWGGKMLRLAHPSAFEGGISELSYAEPVGRKRKADRSCLSELCEDDEDFQWEISDEPQEDMEMSQNYVTTRSFEDSPKDPWSQDWMRDIQQKDDALTKVEALDSRVQELEQQLQTESQHKQEALEKVETFDSRVMELEQQLQVENQQKQEALEKVEMLELRVLELEPQLQTESQQKQEKMEMFDIRVLELEQQLQTESQHKQEALEKMEMFDSRVLELEKQLQAENQQKQEALEKMETFNSRVLELEQQLQAENQQKPESLEKMEMFDSKVLELEQQLQMENQQKQESLEKMEMLELRVLDLERQLEEQSHSQSSSDEQMRREFAETIQLCEQMASEKDVVAAERNYLKDELGMFIEQTESLEKENAALLKELEERREVNEFETLEEELRNEQENKLHEEISCLKKANSDSELHCLELQKKLESLSEELKRKSDFAEELQNMNGKDLVQEVTKLRRSLDDAEGVSRDTKKEWAHLRSQNIALEEANVSLSTSHEKMKAEAESMRSQLEAEKSSFRKIQSDLEKELNVAFDENTKLTALLDGKVPKNLMDSVELERTVSNLNKELTTSRAAEETLRAQLEELASSQAQLENLMQQVRELTEELCATQTQRDGLISAQTQSQEEAQQLRDSLQASQEEILSAREEVSAATLREEQLREQLESVQSSLENSEAEKNLLNTAVEEKHSTIQSLSAELQCVREEKETLRTLAQSSAEETEKLQSAVSSLTEERDQLKTDMQESVEMMIENQEELRAALEKNTEQKKLIEELQTAQTPNQDTPQPETSEQLEKLQTQIQSLTEQLQSVVSERDCLLSERTASSHSEEMEKLQHRVTSLSTDRDQLQETLEALREQKQQITQEMQDRVDTLQAEMNQLQGTLQAVSQQKNQLEDDLQQNMETATQTQSRLNSLQEQLQEQTERNMEVERLSQERQTQVTEAECRLQSVQEELQQLKQKQANQMKLSEQKESDLEQQIKGLSEQLVGVQAERDDLLLEKEASCQRVSEEMRRRVTSLSTDRDQLQETLNALREQKQQITQEMQDRVDTLQAEITSLREQLSKQKVEEAEREAELQEKVQQLKEELQVTREKQTIPETEADTSQQLLSEANKSTYALQEQLSSKVRESAMSRLQESTDQLQEALKKFEDFHKFCFKYNSKALKKIQRDMPSLTHLPNTTLNLFNAVDEMGQQGFRTLGEFMDNLQARAQGYKTVFEDLVQKDLDVYEERRLQDVLQCKAQATSCSLKDEDFNMLWEQRLSRLLEKRTLCLQDMESVLGKLWKIIEPFCQELQIEMKSMERLAGNFKNIMKQPVSYGNNFLSQEQDLRSAEAHNRAKTFQSITDEHNRQAESLKLLQSQTDNELREERSRRSTLLQALEGAPLKTEPSLLKDNQRLLLKLQQTEERIRALCEEREQLEEAQITTNSRLSNHKQATQLLQTELQDSQAQVEEKESIIQTLRSKLRQSEENAPPSVAELEKLKNKLFKVETDLSSASEKHQIEIKRMTALLNGKEESLRKLKETLRKSQQQGEESFLQGEDLHARLTNPKGSLITSSVLQEKAKLEEEVKQLHLKIAELESLVSSQLVEINKWKSRAVKLKAKNKSDTDKSPPRTPAKRDLPDTSDSSIIHSPLKKFVAAPREVLDSPRKILSVKNLPDSPKVPWLNSPKSRFFDIEGSSDLISRNCPKQFFDNSGLGTVPEISQAPDTSDAERGAAVGGLSADKKEEWWPLTQEKEQCKTQ
ncbi:centromere-associated protein E isoform X5 [Xyrichtys novacula]|uniref:Centromere-associated protein E n=1 Tax=Xyrichtys novacula TaxID=13765 RepID=A0AAV1GUM7_XYRNO|nr:centromere-associated protein E isoform X5 [Xyrichtys novacula]